MESTQRLTNKINVLRQQVENDHLAAFQHELTIKDSDTLPATADQSVRDRFTGQKKAAELELAVLRQRLSVREPLLAELEAQLNPPKLAA